VNSEEEGEWRLDEADEMMMIAGAQMEDQDLVLAVPVDVVVLAVAVRMGEAIAAVHQMGAAEVVQMADHLQAAQDEDAAALHHQEKAVLQTREEVAAEKVALQADDMCIKT
jgi:hypothetical protein